MARIIYYVASSLDGFISGPDQDISRFIGTGSGVDRYLQDLQDFQTVIMGRKTYEFGYLFGLKPGQAPYKHMENYIFSTRLEFDAKADNVHLERPDIGRVREIKDRSETDVYLCGGGEFAGWLLEHSLIDQLKIKLNPILLGSGTRIFGNSKCESSLKLLKKESFDEGLEFLTYELII